MNQAVKRVCRNCGDPFEFPAIGRGKARLHCSKKCSRAAHQRSRLSKPRPPCRAVGCEAPAHRVNAQLCETHFYRMRRNGTLELRPPVGPRVRNNGYVAITIDGHPVARNGVTYQHRVVLYDAIGPGPHPCHWCAHPVDWNGTGKGKLVVDHLNGVKHDNARANLVPSCHACNVIRGAFLRWIELHPDDPLAAAMRPPSLA